MLSVAVLQQQTVEQPVDVPVPHGRSGRRLHGSLPRQSSTAEQSVDISVRGPRFSPKTGFTAYCRAAR